MIKSAILGYGGRGRMYANKLKRNPDTAVYAVIDISPEKLALAQEELNLPSERLFSSLDDFLKTEKAADYVFVCTQDAEHFEHASKCIKAGYNLVLEKPIACTPEHCVEIEKLAKEKGVKVDVCHVLRYSRYYEKIKEIINSGVLGKIIAVEQTENVGYWHQSHSFVRGDWRRADLSNPMIIAKCCHDLDLAVYLAGSKCKTVSSVGGRKFFNAENAPEGATEYCLGGCKAKEGCPYDAEKIYINGISYIPCVKNLKNHPEWLYRHFWPHSRLMSDSLVTVDKLYDALKTGQFGKCVFLTDNDVVDYQTTVMEFENGVISTLTMTAFSGKCYRQTRIRGSLGELVCDMSAVTNKIFLDVFGKKRKRIPLSLKLDAHGGGDGRMIDSFAEGKLKSDISMSIESHLIGFAAEKSRIGGGAPQKLEDYR